MQRKSKAGYFNDYNKTVFSIKILLRLFRCRECRFLLFRKDIFNMTQLVILPDIQDLIPSLTPEEHNGLEKSIKNEGCRDPLVVWNNTLLDGHNRYEICNKHSIEYKTVELSFSTMTEAQIWIIDNAINKRNLNAYQKTTLQSKKQGILESIAKEKQREAGGDRKSEIYKEQTKESVVQKSAQAIKKKIAPKTRDIIAKAAGVSHDTVHKVTVINKKATPEIKEKLITGDVSINEAYKNIQREENKIKREEISKQIIVVPSKKYRCIVVDPPWQMAKIERDVRPNQHGFDYPTMDEEELKNLPVPELSFDDCHLYLWATHKKIPLALSLAEHWGFRYQCLLTWVKNVGFTPFSWMYSTEHILFCRKGKLDLLKLGVRLDFNAKVREHSRKPDEFYEIVKRVSPAPLLDMFSREKRTSFEQYGYKEEIEVFNE